MGSRTECWDALALAEDTIIIPRAQFKPHEPFHALHLFAGGFGGWSRAMHWLAREVPHISIATELFVDNDDKVMDVWSYQTGLRYHKGKSVSAGQVNLAAKAGLCTSVDDPTILHCWKCASNSVATASPPCISWSQGGKRQGLSCSSGFAMAETVMLAEVHQPLLLFLECADTTVSHEHFPLVENMLHLIGYRKVWHQVVAMHHLSNNSRSRWLAVWARVDLALRPHEANFELRAPPLVKWNDPSNEFWTPESFHCQLRLSAEALSKYGNPGLLPPAKRARTNAETSTQETLQLRLADTTQPLPTLCSSYTRQHLLQAESWPRVFSLRCRSSPIKCASYALLGLFHCSALQTRLCYRVMHPLLSTSLEMPSLNHRRPCALLLVFKRSLLRIWHQYNLFKRRGNSVSPVRMPLCKSSNSGSPSAESRTLLPAWYQGPCPCPLMVL